MIVLCFTNRYANYVLQTAVSLADSSQLAEFTRCAIPFLSQLRDNVRTKWCKILKTALTTIQQSSGVNNSEIDALSLSLQDLEIEHEAVSASAVAISSSDRDRPNIGPISMSAHGPVTQQQYHSIPQYSNQHTNYPPNYQPNYDPAYQYQPNYQYGHGQDQHGHGQEQQYMPMFPLHTRPTYQGSAGGMNQQRRRNPQNTQPPKHYQKQQH